MIHETFCRKIAISQNVNKIVLILCLVANFTLASAQLLVTGSKAPVPLSPNAASLGKYGDVPVSLYTGIPNISIPLYDINIKGFHLPISLSYHAGGIKVEDVPSWVGTGWSLNAGGVINRQQHGIPDEEMVTYSKSYSNITSSFLSNEYIALEGNYWKTLITSYCPLGDDSTWTKYSLLELALKQGKYDTESDSYYFSCGNESAKFMMNSENRCFTIPASNYKISNNAKDTYGVNNGLNMNYFFSQWIVKNQDGVEFVFGKSRITPSIIDWEITKSSGGDLAVNSWFVNEIKLPGGDQILFQYDSTSYTMKTNQSFVFPYDAPTVTTTAPSSIQYIKVLRLKQIDFPQGKIVFVPGADRTDLSGEKVLGKIEIYHKSGESFLMDKYFTLSTNNTGARFALISVSEISPLKSTANSYNFEYNNISGLPAQTSYSQDWWGYYNGASASTNAPSQYLVSDSWLNYQVVFNNGNKYVDTTKCQYGMLTKITYPTGGTSSFEYESNTARAANSTLGSILLAGTTALQQTTSGSKDVGVGISLQNTTGYNSAYSDSFYLKPLIPTDISNSVYVESSIMDGSMPYTTISGVGKRWNDLQIDIEEKQTDGTYTYYLKDAYFDRAYSLSPYKTYRFKMSWKIANSTYKGWTAHLTALWKETKSTTQGFSYDPNTDIIGGGVRIKTIKDYDPVSLKISTKRFSYDFLPVDDNRSGSSGFFTNLPVMMSRICNASNDYPFSYNVFFGGFNNSSLYQTNGGNVGYKRVNVDYGDKGENGRMVSYFSTVEDYSDVNDLEMHYWPYRPIVSSDWKRGLLLKTLYYKSPDTYTPLKTEINEYEFYDTLETEHKTIIGQLGLRNNLVCPFFVTSAPFFKKKTTSTQLLNSKQVSQVKSITQSAGALAEESVSFINSDGVFSKEVNRYVADLVENSTSFDDDNSNALYGMYHSQNRISVPIESYLVKTVDNVDYVTGGTLMTYKPGVLEPNKFYKLQLDSPLPINEFSPCSIHAGKFSMDTHYVEEISYDSYDSCLNLLESHGRNSLKNSFLWGYNGQYVVASISGCSYATALSVVSQSQIDEACSTGDDEKLRSLLLSLQTDSRTNGAQVAIYTYKPLVGMTSSTDPRGVTTYYEYDDFNRLKRTYIIENNQEKTIRSYDYHYQNQ